MDRPRSDTELVRANGQGELAAFAELVERYQEPLFRNALCYVRRPEEARDVVQEALLKAFEELPGLDDPEKFGSWMRRIVRNLCLNALRSRRRTQTAREELGKEWSGETFDRHSVEKMGMTSVTELLARLPEESAQAFTMHYVEGMRVEAIARRLGRSSQSIKQRLYRARRQLQKEVLEMIKDSVEREKLPDDFPGRVVAGLLESGRRERRQMRYDEARGRFREALEADPENPQALLELGRTYDPLEWPGEDEVQTLERAAAAAPDSVEVACELETAYRRPGREREHEEVFEKCLALGAERLAENPGDVRVLKCMARLRMGAGDFAAAEELLRAAVEEAPEDQQARFQLGRAVNRQARYEEAMEIYEETRGMDSKTVWAYFAMRELATHLVFRRGEGERAVALMGEVWKLTRRPNEAGNLIYFYSATGQLREALERFEAVAENRHHPRVYATAGMACVEAGDWDKAEQMLSSAVDAANDDSLRAEVQVHRARVLFAVGKTAAAQEALEEGLTLDPARCGGLAQGKGSAFWGPWTRWLGAALEELEPRNSRVKPLLEAVRGEVDSSAS